MKRLKKLFFGGIQRKVFSLILVTVLVFTTAYLAISAYRSSMVVRLAVESNAHQQATMAQINTSVMNQVVAQSLHRSCWTEAHIANDLFKDVRDRVAFMGDYARRLFAHPDHYAPKPYAPPDPADDGTWTAMVIYAGGVDPDDPALAAKLGLLANLSDVMVSMCPSFGAANAYIALPEGAHLSINDHPSSWFSDGQIRSYDPRKRSWYRQAAEAGAMIFTDGGWDANTGGYCIVCAVPVYGPDGALEAVIGADLFLNEMLSVLQGISREGEYTLFINQDGRPVLEPQAEAFPLAEEDRAGDLRDSRFAELAQVAGDALRGEDAGAALGELVDGLYYITAIPIDTTGWALITAYSQEIAGKPGALLQERCAQIQAETAAAYQAAMAKLRATAGALLLLVTALTLAGAQMLGKRIVMPLNIITRRISELSNDNLEFKMEDAYRTGDEVEALAQAFATISHKTVEYMDRIVKVTAEKERIGAELSLATEIQADMLPHTFPPFPNRHEFDLYASMDPAREVGGDFYDYFLVDDDHLCVMIADVSGKGVPAALFMMSSMILLRNLAMMGYSPAEILARTNAAICSNNDTKMFVTVWVGILEISTGRLTAANAGHEYPVLKRPDGPFELYRDKHGFVIGGLERARYREYELRLEPGAKLFVYTDGVPEATNAEEEMFEISRMLDALNEQPDAAPKQILENVRAAVDGFVKDAEQFDDLTMLCVEYRGGGASPDPQ